MSDYSAVAPPPQNFNQSSAFAAALQRAKQIAAKINPATGTTGDNRQKRPLEEGQEPDAKKGPGNIGPPPPQQQQGPPLGGPPMGGRPNSNLNQGNMGGPGMGGPTHNEEMKVPDKMVGLIIGRGGEQISRLQAESGCKIQMAQDSLGMPDRICSLSGSEEAVNRAKVMIHNLIHQRGRNEGLDQGLGGDPPIGGNHCFPGMNNSMGGGGHGPPGGMGGGPGMGGPGMGGGGGGPGGRNFIEIMIPGPKVGLIIGKGGETIKQLQEKSGAKMVVIQDGPNQEQEKPLRISGDPQKVEYAKQLIYDLIAEKEMQSFRGGGRRNNDDGGNYNDGGYGGGGGPRGGGGQGFEVLVPRAAVGVVIGKGGDMIKKIQAETGARVQFQQAREEGPGERSCFLQGNPKQVEQARQRIEELIESVQRRDTEGPGGPGAGRRGGGGRGGREGGFDNRGGGGGRNGGGGDYGGGGWEDRRNNQNQGGAEVSFNVPANKCGVIIGRGGETIKQLNAQSGAHCELDRRNQNPNATEKTFIIRGDPDAIEMAKRIIQEKIQMPITFINSGGPPSMTNSMPTAYPGMAPQGYNPQGWGMPAYQQQQAPQQPPSQQWGNPSAQTPDQGVGANPQMNPGTGQADYSMQWAEYYRSLGMHREAEMIEQQAKNKAATGQPAAVGQAAPVPTVAPSVPAAAPVAAASAANGQPDYSAQWAEYYRSIGKLKEAEAIEAQMKNKLFFQNTGPIGQNPTAPGPGQAPAGYYGAQPTQGVPATMPQSGYGFPSYGYGTPNAGGPPGSQEN
ncbi:far upstream element-binding protein 1 isoform X3 [Harmonia axyridis]|uniref:far upstream element-binding protein 1 isoform X3 n=1 Tax=Harmonia axyridis TaxID=115357 RepID=UPI001E277262|nr:far upstream element-binding protein 1 isoform X3 [Harmonia axyridis]